MYNYSPISRYQQAVDSSLFQADEAQYQAIQALEQVYVDFCEQQQSADRKSEGLRQWLQRKLGKVTPETVPVQGVYMWGGVGRGKTWLMDLFYDSLPGERKLRLHFHRFMLRVHQSLTRIQGELNPLEKIADEFKTETDILCFDEFFVSDITDAMLLGTLFEALFARGIALVATSNIPPDNLYHNGLQRARFLPAIELVKRHCRVMNVDAGIDYRLRTLTQANLFITPLDAASENTMQVMFTRLCGDVGPGEQMLEINHHSMQALNVMDGVLAVSYAVLCEQARSSADYIELARLYHTVLLHGVQPMSGKQEDAARRFIAMIDEFYERKVKLMISSAVPMEQLYQGERLRFEFQRCFSRLQEMQSEEYLRLEHLP